MSGSVLKYGEQTSLQTTSQILSAKEAYFYSRVKMINLIGNQLILIQ